MMNARVQNMTSTAQKAAEIRATLKREHGWTSRQVSVRADNYSGGSAIRVVINDPAIPLAAVKRVAEAQEKIARDHMTGEILGGGNTYVTVRYDPEALRVIGRRYADETQRAVNAIEPGSNALEPVGATGFLVGRPDLYRITLWNSQHYVTDANSVDRAAETIGIAMLAKGKEG